MKKRMISLVLVVAMLLCVLPAASAAENDPAPAFYSYYLSLSESIAIKFKFANSNENCYVTFNDGAEKVPVKNGIVTYADMSPAELAKDVKVTLYNGDTEITSKTVSALGYCKAILNGNSYSANMKNLAADLINFGIAFRASKDNASEYKEITKPENIGAYASVVVPAMEQCASDSTFAAGTISGGVALEDAVMLYVECAGAEKIVFTKEGGASVTVEPETTAKGRRFYFRGLNPAEMRKKVTVKGLDANGNEIGTLTTTIEDYAADCNDVNASAELAAYAGVTKAMMQYGDAVAGYVAASASDVLYYNNFNYAASGATATGTYTINSDGQFEAVASKTNPDPFQINFANSKQKISVEWDFKSTLGGDIKSFRSGMTFMVGNSVLWLPIDAYTFKVVDKAGETSTNVSWTDNKTYKMKVELDTVNDTYKYYIGDELKASGTLRRDITYCTNFGLDTGSFNGNSTLTVYIDNLVVKQIP